MSKPYPIIPLLSLAVSLAAVGVSLYGLHEMRLGVQAQSEIIFESVDQKITDGRQQAEDSFEVRVEQALASIVERRRAEAAAADQKDREERQARLAMSSGNDDAIGPLSFNDDGQVVYGNPDAPVTVFTFEDFRCTYCAKYHPTLQQFINESQGQVNWIYKPYPILGPASDQLALAGECIAQEEGPQAFWRYAEQAYATKNWRTAVKYSELADPDKIAACVKENRYGDRVGASLAEGRELNINGTPASVFRNNLTEKGSFIPGFLQTHQIAQMVEEIKGE